MNELVEDVSGALGLWNIAPSRLRPDLAIAGSPERTTSRTVVEDIEGRLFIVESLDPRQLDRKKEIARILAVLSERLPEAKAYLPLPDGEFIGRSEGRFWQVGPFVEGAALSRPEYAGEGWRGPVLADLLVRLGEASRGVPSGDGGKVFSVSRFVRDFEAKVRDRDPILHARVLPALRHLDETLFPAEAGLPAAFAHGDFHPLNMVWSPTGIGALIDWEFCGRKVETYDAAVLVGCLGMEHPQNLVGDFVFELVSGLRKTAGYSEASWVVFFDLVLALRFAWLSDWLRRADAEMIDLEAVYLGLLLANRGTFVRSWGL
jgi:homoserine kinase type II